MKINSSLTLLILLLSFAAACAGGPTKSELDAEVKRLCAVDGGIKVYETVVLPRGRFNQWGQVNFYHPTQKENALGPEYVFKWDIHYFRQGQPTLNPEEISMRRDQIQIIRKLDMKVLGELVTYHRAGGDLPGPWMPSSYRCPEGADSGETELMRRVFVKEGAEK